MSEIKVGEVVVVKTTGEQVFVLEVDVEDVGVKVRIPVLTRDGIKHQKFVFTAAELETSDDRTLREMQEHLDQAQQFKTLAPAPVADETEPGEQVN